MSSFLCHRPGYLLFVELKLCMQVSSIENALSCRGKIALGRAYIWGDMHVSCTRCVLMEYPIPCEQVSTTVPAMHQHVIRIDEAFSCIHSLKLQFSGLLYNCTLSSPFRTLVTHV
jgi:hypothetical protein